MHLLNAGRRVWYRERHCPTRRVILAGREATVGQPLQAIRRFCYLTRGNHTARSQMGKQRRTSMRVLLLGRPIAYRCPLFQEYGCTGQ
jgi:hypothetical protein